MKNEEEFLNKNLLEKVYNPVELLVIYKEDPGMDYYIEQHPVSLINNKYQALAGNPVNIKTVEKVFRSLVKNNSMNLQFSGLIPESVLYFTNTNFNETLIWWEKQQIRTLFFDENLGIGTKIICEMPPVLFMVQRKSLTVFALNVNEKPNEKKKLYYMPLPNLYDNQTVCMGTAKIKKNHASVEEMIQDYSFAFWNSEFNSFHGSNEKRFNGSFLQYIKELGKAKFNLKNLKSAKKTVKTLMNEKFDHY